MPSEDLDQLMTIAGSSKTESTPCRVCSSPCQVLFVARVLNKYEAEYLKCAQCSFIQVETPHWLAEAYSEAISSLDVGMVKRNLDLSEVTARIIRKSFEYEARFLDYAGGYGLFVRLMRDKGYDFFRCDKYCKNLFAINHDLTDLPAPVRFELLTAFEVFEHLRDPHAEVEGMLKLSDSILFTTEITPTAPITRSEDWWYFAPETGQHISFYSIRSLELLAEVSRCYFWTNRRDIHMFSRKKFKSDPLTSGNGIVRSLISKALRKLTADVDRPPNSLIPSDFEFAKARATVKSSLK